MEPTSQKTNNWAKAGSESVVAVAAAVTAVALLPVGINEKLRFIACADEMCLFFGNFAAFKTYQKRSYNKIT